MKTFTESDVANILDCAKVQADMLRERIQELETEIREFVEDKDCIAIPDYEAWIDVFQELLGPK